MRVNPVQSVGLGVDFNLRSPKGNPGRGGFHKVHKDQFIYRRPVKPDDITTKCFNTQPANWWKPGAEPLLCAGPTPSRRMQNESTCSKHLSTRRDPSTKAGHRVRGHDGQHNVKPSGTQPTNCKNKLLKAPSSLKHPVEWVIS